MHQAKSNKLLLTYSLLKKNKLDIAVASAAPMDWIKKCLMHARTGSFFDVIPLSEMFSFNNVFSAQNCKNTKPAPDVFLKACSSFGSVKTLEDLNDITFVIGDSYLDVLGGLASGFNVLYLSDKNTEFDNNSRVKRFSTSLELSSYVIKELI